MKLLPVEYCQAFVLGSVLEKKCINNDSFRMNLGRVVTPLPFSDLKLKYWLILYHFSTEKRWATDRAPCFVISSCSLPRTVSAKAVGKCEDAHGEAHQGSPGEGRKLS